MWRADQYPPRLTSAQEPDAQIRALRRQQHSGLKGGRAGRQNARDDRRLTSSA